MAEIKLVSNTATSLTVKIAGAQSSTSADPWIYGDRTVLWLLDREFTEKTSLLPGDSTESETITISGLKPGTSYLVSAQILRNDTGSLLADIDGRFTTLTEVSGGDITGGNWQRVDMGIIEERVSNLAVSFSNAMVYRYTVIFSHSGTAVFELNDATDDEEAVITLSETPYFDTINGIPVDRVDFDDYVISHNVTAGTPYYVWIGGRYTNNKGQVLLTINPPAGLNRWDWGLYPNDDYILSSKGETLDFSYLVWNALVEKTREAYLFKTDDPADVYLTKLDEARMSNSENGRVLTAKRFNSLRYVIGSELKTFNTDDNAIFDRFKNDVTSDWDMLSGEYVKSDYVYALTKKLNEGIDIINKP